MDCPASLNNKQIQQFPGIAPAPALARSGFTLMEMLVVVAVLMVLSAIGSTAWTQVAKRGKVGASQTVVMAVATAIESHQRQQLAIPVAKGSGWSSRLGRLWDLNEDGWLDADPSQDPQDPVDSSRKEFTASERADAVAANYHGLIGDTPGLALAQRHITAELRIVDAWKRPLRIAYAPVTAQGGDGRFAGRPLGIWSLGLNGQDENGAGDDIISWK